MVRFVHTADWQLGAKFSEGKFDESKAERLREARFEAVRNLLRLARREGVDFVIVAGDVVEDNTVGNSVLQGLRVLFEDFSDVKVYIVPGNHDPLTPESVYRVRREFENLPENVKVLTEERPVKAKEGVVLYPCPCRSKGDSSDPTEWIPPRGASEKGLIRIGIAHGNWQVLPDVTEDEFPIPSDVAEAKGLDYVALGHWHSTFPEVKEGEGGRVYYSGTPEPCGFGERDSGNVLVVEIPGPGGRPLVRKEKVATMRWVALEREVSDEGSVKVLDGELHDLASEKTLVRLALRGAVNVEAKARLDRALKKWSEEFFWFEVEDRTFLSPSEEEIREHLSALHPLLGEVGRRLLDLQRGEGKAPEEWPREKWGDRPPKEVAKRALEILFAMCGEMRR